MRWTRKYLRPVMNIALGAGAVVGGAYVVSRIKEKQDTETRLDRLEQMIESLSEEKEGSRKPKSK